MFFRIDPSNGIPIYDQIVRQVKFAAANQTLTPGDLVPSVRELAKNLAVNPNTVARAYRELQTDGVLATIRGTGLEVTSGAPKRCRGGSFETHSGTPSFRSYRSQPESARIF